MRAELKTVIGFEAPSILVQEADRMAERLGVSRSEVLRLAVISFLDNGPKED